MLASVKSLSCALPHALIGVPLRVVYPTISLSAVLLSVVIVNWNSRTDLAVCLRSMRAQTHDSLEIIVIDNGSSDGSAQLVKQDFPEVTLIAEAENLGFAEACNRGIEA
ncbi:MAG: glycosyltransferase, partial [Polyangiaceae bacterium]